MAIATAFVFAIQAFNEETPLPKILLYVILGLLVLLKSGAEVIEAYLSILSKAQVPDLVEVVAV